MAFSEILKYEEQCLAAWERLGVTPPALDTEHPDFSVWREWGDDYFAAAHTAYMAKHKEWARACDEYTKLANAQTPKPEKIAEAEKRRDGLHGELKLLMVELLRGRAVEEHARPWRTVQELLEAEVDGCGVDLIIRTRKNLTWVWAHTAENEKWKWELS